jgi:hypothetical protein
MSKIPMWLFGASLIGCVALFVYALITMPK